MTLWQHQPSPSINPGDLIIKAGIKASFDSPDKFVIAGTPWIWDQCSNTEKYVALESVLSNHNSVIALGIGSCLPLDMDVDSFLETNRKGLDIWKKVDYITVRDPVAFDILSEVGVKSELLPCPSIHAPFSKASSLPGSVLAVDAPVWYGGHVRLSVENTVRLNYNSSAFWTEEAALQQLSYFSQFETIYSARIHAVIPLASCRDTYILPLDSRYLAATKAGCKPLTPNKPNL